MKRTALYWLIIFLFGIGVRSSHLLHPIDTESWREGDMATIAKNIYQNNGNIFHPQISWDGKGPGYTESEFQLYTGLISCWYKIFGFWEPAGRVISFIFSLCTLIVFFKLSNYLFPLKKALTVSFFFAAAPLLMVLANTIQPESVMFFFYVAAAFTFIRWIYVDTWKNYLLALVFTATAILCKMTSAHIGILFILLIITLKGWRYLFNYKVLIFGVFSIIPGLIWYLHTHDFYTQYGNSLGISNEYALIGMDFFTDRYFIGGLITLEINNVWTIPGMFIFILALFTTDLKKVPGIFIAIYWYAAAIVFYLLAVRTTADDWAFYYHIFSIPAASILLGIAVVELYEKYFSTTGRNITMQTSKPKFIKQSLLMGTAVLLAGLFIAAEFSYIYKDKHQNFLTSPFYSCVPKLSGIIEKNTLILCSGGPKLDRTGYPVAYNKSYFFYWLNLKGYNIPDEDQSVEKISAFREKGVQYFLAEERSLKLKPGLEDTLNKRFNVMLACNGIVLYDLRNSITAIK